jgi:endonuclease/exonuclease/phosphatase (EEP) superfamily protein YafD
VAAVLAAGAPAAADPGPQGRADYSLLQMNLCLSGLAGCYPGTRYPAVVDEAVATIEGTAPDAVTLDEACSGDVARMAAETGYHARFSAVVYGGAPFGCSSPGGRGVFGIAVLARATLGRAVEAPYRAQFGPEERRWLCVGTADGVRACASHLAGAAEDAVANGAQCAELARVLAAESGATIFGGDLNRRRSCAPAGLWTVRDEQAGQSAGIQHAYGSRQAFTRPRATVLPMTYSDHDALLIHAWRHP